jgi:folate-binding protein YgfZ
LAHCRVHFASDSLLLESEAGSRQAVLDYLDQYIIMDDVAVSDETDSTAAIALEGPELQSELTAALAELGTVHPSALTGPRGTWFELTPQARPQAEALLASRSIPIATPNDQLAARVENGIPLHGVDYTSSNIPHETQLLKLVSFDKGCYVGQEIV